MNNKNIMSLKNLLSVALFLFVLNVSAQKYTNVEAVNTSKSYEGDSFSSINTFVQNVNSSDSFSVLSEILENEQLRNVIESEEMVTIFAPLDTSFSKLSDDEKEAFMLDTDLQSQFLKMHTIPGRMDLASLKKAIEQNNGRAQLKTLAGTKLTAIANKRGEVFINDQNGNKAQIVETNFYHKNGFFHLIDGVAAPTKKE